MWQTNIKNSKGVSESDGREIYTNGKKEEKK
jgi:hypothetical protein